MRRGFGVVLLTIQAAIDEVVDGDVIELIDGMFTGDGNRDMDYLGKALTIRSQSGDPDLCITPCGALAEEHRGFHFHSNEGPGSVLSGIQAQPIDCDTATQWRIPTRRGWAILPSLC